MELVYLWIEKYKNIKRQGFTFSPRFDCEFKPKYNENDELIPDESELIIEEKKDYVNIFPDNINITAIIGKNGAGKSNLIEIFFKMLYYYENNIKFCYIFYHKQLNKIYIYNNLNLKRAILKAKNYLFCNKIQHIFISIDTLSNIYELFYSILIDFSLLPYRNIDNQKDTKYKKYFSLEPTRDYETGGAVNKIEPKSFNSHMRANILSFYKYIKRHSIKDFQDFSSIKSIKISKKFKLKKREIKKILDILSEILELINEKNKNLIINKKKLSNVIEKINEINQIFNKNNIDLNNYEKILYDKLPYLVDFIKEKLKNKITDKNEKINIKNIIFEYIKYELLNNIFNNKQYSRENLIDIKAIDKLNNEDIEIISKLMDLINVDINLDNGIKFDDLSNGQKIIISYLGLISKKIYLNKNFIIFIDEIETGLHPEWQRKFLNYIILFFKKNHEKNFQIVLSTHSPFILSDLPKENIIFMKEGKNVSDEVDIKTFGANIHTLLTHGFFMEEGLMGEYAKEKIHQTIKLLNEPKLTNKEIEFCEKIISIIGEPIIKKQLQRMLDSKKLKKIDKIDELEKEIELIKAKIEILRKNS